MVKREMKRDRNTQKIGYFGQTVGSEDAKYSKRRRRVGRRNFVKLLSYGGLTAVPVLMSGKLIPESHRQEITQSTGVVTTASYTVFIDPNDGEIKTQNGTTGTVESSGLDASKVIQYAIDKLTDGGMISIRRGEFLAADQSLQISKLSNYHDESQPRTNREMPSLPAAHEF